VQNYFPRPDGFAEALQARFFFKGETATHHQGFGLRDYDQSIASNILYISIQHGKAHVCGEARS
jgi:hypothetical protein